MKKIYILRSCTGGGKSTLARKMTINEPNYAICSADDYHYFGTEQIPSNYKFDLNNLHAAHQQCKHKFIEALNTKSELIIVDNTNIKLKDYKWYYITGREYGYDITFHTILPGTVEQHFNSNVHNVPKEAIERMIAGLQPVPPEINGEATKEIFYNFDEIREK